MPHISSIFNHLKAKKQKYMAEEEAKATDETITANEPTHLLTSASSFFYLVLWTKNNVKVKLNPKTKADVDILEQFIK